MIRSTIETNDLYSTELLIRREADFELLHRIPASDKPAFSTAVLKNSESLIVLNRKSDCSEEKETEYRQLVKSKENSRNLLGELLDGAEKCDLPQHHNFAVSPQILRPEGIIFDLDGTLIDSEPNYYESDRLLMAEYGVEFSEEMKKKYVGVGNSFMMEDLRRKYDLRDPMEILLEKKNRYYMDIARRNTRIFPEMKKLVERLHAMGLILGIASGSSPDVIEELTEIVGIRKYFDILLSSEEVPRGKPDPDIFIEAARRLGVKASEALVFEDTQYGVEAAVRAGMRCVAIPTIYEPLDENFIMADLLFSQGMKSFSADAVLAWLGE